MRSSGVTVAIDGMIESVVNGGVGVAHVGEAGLDLWDRTTDLVAHVPWTDFDSILPDQGVIVTAAGDQVRLDLSGARGSTCWADLLDARSARLRALAPLDQSGGDASLRQALRSSERTSRASVDHAPAETAAERPPTRDECQDLAPVEAIPDKPPAPAGSGRDGEAIGRGRVERRSWIDRRTEANRRSSSAFWIRDVRGAAVEVSALAATHRPWLTDSFGDLPSELTESIDRFDADTPARLPSGRRIRVESSQSEPSQGELSARLTVGSEPVTQGTEGLVPERLRHQKVTAFGGPAPAPKPAGGNGASAATPGRGFRSLPLQHR